MTTKWVACLAVLTVSGTVAYGLAPSFQGLGENTLPYEVAGDGSKVIGRDSVGRAAFWTRSGGWTDLGFGGYAYGVSGDGSAITGWSGESSSTIRRNRGFLWTEGDGLEWLGDLPGGGPGTMPKAISADGLTVVGDSQSADSARDAFRWTRDGMVSLRSDLGDPNMSRAQAVSGDGSRIVGAYERSSGFLSGSWMCWLTPATGT